MKKSKRKIDALESTPETERWGVVQVAVHMKLSPQTARNHMMAGRFGASEYDAATRKLTVLAALVRGAPRHRNGTRVPKRPRAG